MKWVKAGLLVPLMIVIAVMVVGCGRRGNDKCNAVQFHDDRIDVLVYAEYSHIKFTLQDFYMVNPYKIESILEQGFYRIFLTYPGEENVLNAVNILGNLNFVASASRVAIVVAVPD